MMQQLPAATRNQRWQQHQQHQHQQQRPVPTRCCAQPTYQPSRQINTQGAAAMAVLLPAQHQERRRRGEVLRCGAAETSTTVVVEEEAQTQQQQQQQQQEQGGSSTEGTPGAGRLAPPAEAGAGDVGAGRAKPIAFVLDIDGVLVQGPRVLPAAQRALRSLYSEDGSRALHPVVFLTNGGGQTEAEKAAQLSGQLGVTVEEQQVVMAHTPFRDLLPALGHLPVLAVGRGALTVARHYGFERAVTARQLACAYPAAVPFVPQGPVDEPGEGSAAWPIADAAAGTAGAPLAAILVFNDPEDWYLDLQLCCDVLTSGGVLDGSSSSGPTAPPPSVPIYFGNADLLFANEFPAPRFGQGAFGVALEALYGALMQQHAQQQPQQQSSAAPSSPSAAAASMAAAAATGSASSSSCGGRGTIPNRTTYGKPNPEPYALVERLLAEQAAELGLVALATSTTPDGDDSTSTSSSTTTTATAAAATRQGNAAASTSASPPSSPSLSHFSAIYAVGDNPPADVRGANRAGPPWVSVLVRTGVFKGGPGENCPADPAQVLAEDVEEAVAAALAARVMAAD